MAGHIGYRYGQTILRQMEVLEKIAADMIEGNQRNIVSLLTIFKELVVEFPSLDFQ
jgi:hypothetical protein